MDKKDLVDEVTECLADAWHVKRGIARQLATPIVSIVIGFLEQVPPDMTVGELTTELRTLKRKR